MKVLLSVWALVLASATHAATVAVYNDTDETEWPEGGAWPPLVAATSALMTTLGYSWEYIDADDVNSNNITQYSLLFFPGGWAGGYNEYINQTGYQNIRDFISSGGAYMGMCAGSFFVSDKVLWRENDGLSTPQNVYDYPLDLWPGVADGAIIDFQPWDSSAETGCFFYPGARMVDLRVDRSLMPESNPVVNVLYYGGPIYRPPNGKWTNEQVIARYDMDGFSGDQEPAMVLFPYGEGRVFMSAVHPELSLNENTCQLYYDITAHTFLGQIVARMLAPEGSPEPTIALSKKLSFETAIGRQYQIESSGDGGNTWSAYGDVISSESFEYVMEIPDSDAALQFRIVLAD